MTSKLQINNPRVRFAPSPTGYFHIGSARTALFNWLVAKKYGGKFIIRIEDTDVERSKPEFEKDIIDGLKWLGLFWDEGLEMGGEYGPYRQSKNLDIYEKYLRQLLEAGQAYYCFCSEEELEAKRQDALSRGEVFRYDGHCRNLSSEDVQKKIKNKESFVIRFKIPEKKFVFNDIIRGKVEFDGSLIGDQVIAKNFTGIFQIIQQMGVVRSPMPTSTAPSPITRTSPPSMVAIPHDSSGSPHHTVEPTKSGWNS